VTHQLQTQNSSTGAHQLQQLQQHIDLLGAGGAENEAAVTRIYGNGHRAQGKPCQRRRQAALALTAQIPESVEGVNGRMACIPKLRTE